LVVERVSPAYSLKKKRGQKRPSLRRKTVRFRKTGERGEGGGLRSYLSSDKARGPGREIRTYPIFDQRESSKSGPKKSAKRKVAKLRGGRRKAKARIFLDAKKRDEVQESALSLRKTTKYIRENRENGGGKSSREIGNSKTQGRRSSP